MNKQMNQQTHLWNATDDSGLSHLTYTKAELGWIKLPSIAQLKDSLERLLTKAE
jgi:hypothetical protein